MTRWLSLLAGLGLAVAGVVGVLLSLIAIVDPVGTTMGADADPFGAPPTTVAAALTLLVCLAMAVVGIWLGRRGKLRR